MSRGVRRALVLAALVVWILAMWLVFARPEAEEVSTAPADAGAGEPRSAREVSREGSHGGSHGEDDGHDHRGPVRELVYPYDPADPRQVVGASENVFVGFVVAVEGQEPTETSMPREAWEENGYEPTPQTQFRVRVEKVLLSSGPAPAEKGAEVVVNQMGHGTEPESGEPYTVESFYQDLEGSGGTEVRVYRDEPLELGRRYVLATQEAPGRGWQEISAQPGGNAPIGPDDGGAVEALYRKAVEDPLETENDAPSSGEPAAEGS